MSDDPIDLPARARRLARIRGDIPAHFPLKRFRPGAVVADGFTTTKSEKRMIRRSVFVGNIASSAEAAAADAAAAAAARARKATAADGHGSSTSRPLATPSSSKSTPASVSKPRTKTPSILRARSSKITKPSTSTTLRKSSTTSSSSSSKSAKVRRPSKKLITTLSSLADALPDLSSTHTTSGTVLDGVERGKVRHQSLASKPGALKKKKMVVRGEMERFGVSLARLVGPRAGEPVMAGTATGAGTGTGTGGGEGGGDVAMGGEDKGVEGGAGSAQPAMAGRWQALRGYITSTMERNPAFIS